MFVFHNGSDPLYEVEFTSSDVDGVCNTVLGFFKVIGLRYEKFCDLWELSTDGGLDVFIARFQFKWTGKGEPDGYYPILF